MEKELANKVIQLYSSGKSAIVISKELGISDSAIWRVCKKAGISRTISEINTTRYSNPEERLKLSDKLKGKYTGTNNWGTNIPKENYTEITHELAYIIGVLMGDGYLHKQGIGLQSIDKEFCDKFAECLKIQFGLPIGFYNAKPHIYHEKSNSKDYQCKASYIVRLNSVIILQFIQQIKTHDWVLALPKELKVDWLRGLWDSEGHIDNNKQCALTSKDKTLINLYQQILKESTGIDSKLTTSGIGMTRCYLSAKDCIKFYDIVQPTIQRKRDIFESIKEKSS